MNSRRHYSLTLRLALIFALLAFALLATLGVALYRELERELIKRDDAALIYRADQLRNLLNDSNTLDLIKTKPELFQNMLGNSESVLSIAAPGQKPLLLVNPGNIEMPNVTPVPKDHELGFSDVHHLPGVNGVPFATVAASIDSGDLGSLQVTTGRLMTERTAMLASYRLSVFILASIAAIILALVGYLLVYRGLLPLRRLAKHAQGIGVGNLAERLDSHGAPKELLPMIDSFNTMLERLAKGFVQLGQVSTDMAHELRTPINNLMGKAQVTLSRERSVDEYKDVLVSCTEELERVARIVSDMLFLAQVSHPSALAPFEAVALEVEVAKVAEMFSLSAQDKDIHLNVIGSAQVMGDRLMIQRAISNLLSNALRHCPNGKTVTLLIEQSATQASLLVSNPGAGIEAQHLPYLFDRFYRVDSSRSRSQGSTGLGLAIVRSIMSLHQGVAEVKSLPGAMTVFRLGFPAVPPMAPSLAGKLPQ